MRHHLILLLLLIAGLVRAETHFIECEDFTASSNGWTVKANRGASKLKALHGAAGDPSGTASATLTIGEAGTYRIWVRHTANATRQGPFRLEAIQEGEVVAAKDCDLPGVTKSRRFYFFWESFEAPLAAGPLELRLSKVDNKNCVGYTRFVDCVFLSDNLKQVPNHLDYGTKTWLRVTLDDVYEKPVYIHIFADHFRSPWYGHFNLSMAGAQGGISASRANFVPSGGQTPWCDITRMLYQDSGAILNITARYAYTDVADRLKARFEFATAPEESAIVRTLDVDAHPGGLVVAMPPDLTTQENLDRFGRDLDFAEKTGRLADAYPWPTLGRKPQEFPFFVAVSLGGYGTRCDQAVTDRELKTLDYFGFSNGTREFIGGGVWYAKDSDYCVPDLNRMRSRAAERAAAFKETGKKPEEIVYCMMMDEPGGQGLEFMAESKAYQEAFRAWLKGLGLTPADLLVADWDAVHTVTAGEKTSLPALYYFSQRFRTQALGNFMATQRRVLTEAYGGDFPCVANFSDGATYYANFYGQGVDYFELLDDPDGQNAVWSEDWANGSSSYQCAAYNVDLLRAAARPRKLPVGHYLVAYAGRRPLDVKLKAAGEVARGVKIFKSFSYGVYWGSHEGGPSWRSSAWQAKPEMWGPHAELLREIGGAEDLLMTAMPPPAKVAILYSSSSDVWQVGVNNAFGFDRMHTWMALAHAQVPVDFLSEQQVADGALDGYQVCYLSGPNLTRAAAAKVAAWVRAGGVLSLSAGAASRDEYDRPLDTLQPLLPADRGPLHVPQPFLSSGRYLYLLKPQAAIKAGEASMDVLSCSQPLTARTGSTVVATAADGSPGWVSGEAGKGQVWCAGFLPALDYIRKALVARQALAETVKEEQAAIDGDDPVDDQAKVNIDPADRARLAASVNPWAFPAGTRDAILAPVRAAGVEPPLTCSVPLVDAVVMAGEFGLVIPLANYTLAPLDKVDFTLRVDRPIDHVETIHQGKLAVRQEGKRIAFSLPLKDTDYVKVYYR